MPTAPKNTNANAHRRALPAWAAELAAWLARQNENPSVPPPETNTSIPVFLERLNSELSSQPSQPLPTPTEVADDNRPGALPAEVLLQEIEVRPPRTIGLRLYPVMQQHMQQRFDLSLLLHMDCGDDRSRLVLRGGNRLLMEEAARYLEDIFNDIASYVEECGEFASVANW